MRTKREMLERMDKLNMKTKGNVQNQKEARIFLNTAVEIGNKVLCCLPVNMLKTDFATYQRPLQRNFKYLVEHWDSDRCDPIIVNYRGDGFYYVIDGQHRLEAAKCKGVEQLVCDVFVGLSIIEEADMFAGQYEGSKKLSPLDSYKANIVRGDLLDTTLKEICDSYGITITNNTKIKRRINVVTYLRSILRPERNCDNKEMRIKENRKVLEWIFDVIRDGEWDDYRKSYSSDIIHALHRVYVTCSEDKNSKVRLAVAKERLSDFFVSCTPQKLKAMSDIRYYGFERETKLYKMMMSIVNDDVDERLFGYMAS